jgi:acyl carrier protein
MADNAELKTSIKNYLLTEFLPGEDPDALEDDTPLISGGILDSIATVKLVAFLEEKYGVEFGAHEIGLDYLNSLTDIIATVQAKMG